MMSKQTKDYLADLLVELMHDGVKLNLASSVMRRAYDRGFTDGIDMVEAATYYACLLAEEDNN